MEQVVTIFLDLVRLSSPSKRERLVADYIIKWVQKLGLLIEEDNTGEKINGNSGNLIVHLEGRGIPILFDAHMDTVNPCDEIRPIVDNGIIYSDGTSVLGADDKVGIATMLYLMETLVKEDLPHPPVTFIFTVCEEDSLQGIKNLNLSQYEHVKYAYVLDGEGEIGTIVKQTPFGCKGTLTIKGKEAHAGVCPEEGINALVVASEAIMALPMGRINENLTCNIGKIQGGNATNIVMGEVKMQFEARGYRQKELIEFVEHMKQTFQNICDKRGAKFLENLHYGTPGYTLKEHEPIITSFKKICEQNNIPFHAIACGGGSNASVYQKNGIPALCVGTNMKNVHSTKESIQSKDLQELYQLLLKICNEMVIK